MKNLKRISMLVLLSLAIFTTSCKKDPVVKPTPTPNYNTEAKLDLGSKVNAKFFGRIVDESGTAVSGVAITVGNKTATTDSKGVFIIDDASVYEKLAFVKAVKTGYFMGSRSVIPSTSANNNIKITLLAMDIVATINAGEVKTILLSSGASIDFKGKYIDANGNEYTGAVNVSFKHLPALADATPNQMPGMLYAQDKNENAGILETYGMMAVELTSSNGAELQIDPESNAVIHMPIEASQLADAPATIPLWHFDEVAGYWIEEGEAKLVDGEYVGEVSHFSFWNCDRFGDDARLNGTVLDQDGNVLSNVTVTIITPNAETSGQTSSDGTFFTYVPSDVAIILQVTDECGNIIQSFNVGPYTTNSSNSENLVVTLSATNSVQVEGTFFDCNNDLITNGYVVLEVGTETYFQTVTNGAIDIAILYCNVPSTLSVIAYDYDNLQESNTMTMPVVSPITNLGNLISCNTVTEYVTYTIDGGTQVTIFPPFTANAQLDSLTSVVSGFNVFSSGFELNSSVASIGTHPYGWVSGMTLYAQDISVNTQTTTPTISFNLNAFGIVGDYIDVTFSGGYEDNSNASHTITGTVHVLRDN